MKLLDIPLTDIQAIRILNTELTGKEAMKMIGRKDSRTHIIMVDEGLVTPSYIGNGSTRRYKIIDLIPMIE